MKYNSISDVKEQPIIIPTKSHHVNEPYCNWIMQLITTTLPFGENSDVITELSVVVSSTTTGASGSKKIHNKTKTMTHTLESTKQHVSTRPVSVSEYQCVLGARSKVQNGCAGSHHYKSRSYCWCKVTQQYSR